MPLKLYCSLCDRQISRDIEYYRVSLAIWVQRSGYKPDREVKATHNRTFDLCKACAEHFSPQLVDEWKRFLKQQDSLTPAKPKVGT